MFVYEKKLQYPVKIKNPNPRLAAAIISQYGGPDGELGASLRYLSQRYSMPYPELKGLLTDIGTEELGHLEMVGTIVHQLTRNLTEEQIKEAGFEPYFVDHTTGVFPQFASGYPWSASTMQVTGDTIADLTEDLAAEQKARVTYDNILRLSDDPDVSDVIKFLRAREIVHFQRFGWCWWWMTGESPSRWPSPSATPRCCWPRERQRRRSGTFWRRSGMRPASTSR